MDYAGALYVGVRGERRDAVMEDNACHIFLVPHTHYDAIWVLTKEDYFYINIVLILREVVALLKRSPEYKFLIEQTFLLEEVERRYPRLYEDLRRFIRDGRIEIADGEYLMPDTMLPQEETLVREILVGKRYVREKFGVDVEVMWQADAFGLNAQLPQIYRKSGYRYVAFRRGSPERKPSEFLWEGIDGTRILAHWMPLGYRAGLDLTRLDESYNVLRELAATPNILMPSGSGGMLPQPETIDVVHAWNEKNPEVKMRIATPSEFFHALEKYIKEHGVQLPVRKGEMYSGRYSMVFPSCSSSRMWLKLGLRKYESNLLCCERWATVLHILSGYYPSDELNDCWRMILFTAFHDVIPGTGMDEGYKEVRRNFGYLETKQSDILPGLLREVVGELRRVGGSISSASRRIIVFNHLSWEVRNWVEVELSFKRGEILSINGLRPLGTRPLGTENERSPENPEKSPHERSPQEREEVIDVEIMKFSRYEDESLRYARIGFVASVPPMGYRVYEVVEDVPEQQRDKKQRDKNFIRIVGNTIETRFFKLRIDPEHALIDVLMPDNEVLCMWGNDIVLEEEAGDLYYHRQSADTPLKTESGDGLEFGSFRVENFRIVKSPLRRVVNFESRYYSLRWPYKLTHKFEPIIWRHNFLTCIKKIIVYKDIPRIDFITTIEDKHPRARVRVRFPTAVRSSEYTCECQFGAVRRPTDMFYFGKRLSSADKWEEEPTGIFPSLRWIDYSDEKKGLTVINRGIPENEIRDCCIYLTLLRSVFMLSSDGKTGPAIPVPEARELRRYVFKYALYPHKGDWKDAKSFKHAYEFNYDFVAFQMNDEMMANEIPPAFSFLSIAPENVILTAFKRAEDGNAVILRFYEAEGEKTRAKITLFKQPKSVEEVNLMEERCDELLSSDEREMHVNGKEITLNVRPFEIVTLKLTF